MYIVSLIRGFDVVRVPFDTAEEADRFANNISHLDPLVTETDE